MTPDTADRPVLDTDGFARFTRTDILPGRTPAQVRARLAPLSRYYETLPLDPNAPHTNRYRRYARGVLLPWTRSVTWVPGTPDPEYGAITEFAQGGHNPEYPSARRRLPYIEAGILGDPLLRDLILFDLDAITWPQSILQNPVQVGVHFVKLRVDHAGEQAFSSPNCLHQDGGQLSMYFVHLLARANVAGGANVIAAPECAGQQEPDLSDHVIKARFTLDRPLDSYGVRDFQVSHYVSPIRVADPTHGGYRNTLLIGFIPYADPI
ncbi:MAG: 2OG-Fe dioxygenase family protein [Pseudonocardiaceae bacterium]